MALRKRSATQSEIQQILDTSDSEENDALVYEDNSDMDKYYVKELSDSDESDMSLHVETSDTDENENEDKIRCELTKKDKSFRQS